MIEHLALAKDHLAKAKEFLEAAQVNHDHELFSAAAAELKASGPVGADLAPTLRRLLGLKPKAQYQSKKMTGRESASAVSWAQRLYDGAESVVNS